jgi:tol-pal system protein YbgF
MEGRIQRLEEESAEADRRIEEQRALVRDRVAKLDQKLVEVQDKIDELNKAARRSGADLGVGQARLQDDFAKVKGDLEVEQHRLGQIEKALADIKVETEGRFAALKGTGALDEFEARRRTESLQRKDDPEAFFALARKEEATGDKGVARELYQQYASKWPADPKAAEASYRAGEILFAQRRYREAILAHGKVAEGFPRSDLAPSALVRIGEAMIALDMKDDATAILGQVLDRYPKSPAAPRAKKLLASLAPQKKATKKK